MSKDIKLTQGQVAIVCDCHAYRVEGEKWYAVYNVYTKSFYAKRHSRTLLGKRKIIPMHSVINGTPDGFETDHQNGNTLDNRCSNLRTATPSQNAMNQRVRSDNTSGRKGVAWDKQHTKWRADIQLNGKKKCLGYFDSAEEAARAYDAKAIELHGKFARTNF